jgi:hypothetical protein
MSFAPGNRPSCWDSPPRGAPLRFMRKKRRRTSIARASLAIALFVFAIPAAVTACPICHSETGEQVRAALFGPNFSVHLLSVLSPFPIFAAIVLGLRVAFAPRGPDIPRGVESSNRSLDLSPQEKRSS